MVTKKKTPSSKIKSEPHLFMFNGEDCAHCRNMDSLVTKLEKELKVHVAKLEVWNNSKNAELLEKLDDGKCGGVPFFWNAKKRTWICGETDYDELKAWAK